YPSRGQTPRARRETLGELKRLWRTGKTWEARRGPLKQESTRRHAAHAVCKPGTRASGANALVDKGAPHGRAERREGSGVVAEAMQCAPWACGTSAPGQHLLGRPAVRPMGVRNVGSATDRPHSAGRAPHGRAERRLRLIDVRTDRPCAPWACGT